MNHVPLIHTMRRQEILVTQHNNNVLCITYFSLKFSDIAAANYYIFSIFNKFNISQIKGRCQIVHDRIALTVILRVLYLMFSILIYSIAFSCV